MMTVISATGRFEYPKGTQTETDPKGQLLVLDTDENVIAKFAAGEWKRAVKDDNETDTGPLVG